MKLYLKRYSLESGCQFTIFDENDNLKYKIVLENLLLGFSIYIIDSKNEEKSHIIQTDCLFAYLYIIKTNKQIIDMITNINKDAKHIKFWGADLAVDGDILSKNFCLLSSDGKILMDHKVSNFYPQEYEINIYDNAREELFISIAICIDILNSYPIQNPIIVE